MTVKKINGVVCDLDGCANIATKQILFSEKSSVGLNLCDHCLMNLYDLMAQKSHEKGGRKVGKKQG
jgi:hypothetical protein